MPFMNELEQHPTMTTSRTFATALLAAFAGTAMAAEIPVDLSGWSKRGPASNGNWVVAPGGASVNQTINGDPTFFVGPDTFLNTVLRGKIRVATSGDDDFIGFVMGYSAPVANGNDMNYVLLDWKQVNQNFSGAQALEGFTLNRVNGTITNYIPGFWGHADSVGFDNLANNHGNTLGWADNTEYSFEISYMANRVTVNVTGGVYAAPTTVLDVAGSFPSGQFGFYNYSQAQVTYSGFTLEQLPPPPVPEPATYGLMLLGLLGLGVVRRKRAQ